MDIYQAFNDGFIRFDQKIDRAYRATKTKPNDFCLLLEVTMHE